MKILSKILNILLINITKLKLRNTEKEIKPCEKKLKSSKSARAERKLTNELEMTFWNLYLSFFTNGFQNE